MESVYLISLIFISTLNVIFFFSGICLNSVVIISFWRSVQLRKKTCYFMIMILSCCDIFSILTNSPLMVLFAILWLTGNLELNSTWPYTTLRIANISFAFSLLALLVMNFDRYLATSYPIFHRTSVTKKRLVILLVILIMLEVTLVVTSICFPIISRQVQVLIFFIFVTPPMLFINYKLYAVVKRSRKNSRMSQQMNKTFSLKNISSCLLATVCFVVFFIPVFVSIGLRMSSRKSVWTFDDAYLSAIWAESIILMNCTFNCLIFYWKNKTLRTEGWKVIKSLQIWCNPSVSNN